MIEKEIARIKSELADIGCLFTCGKTCEEKVSELFKKALDKTHRVCYNNNCQGELNRLQVEGRHSNGQREREKKL